MLVILDTMEIGFYVDNKLMHKRLTKQKFLIVVLKFVEHEMISQKRKETKIRCATIYMNNFQ